MPRTAQRTPRKGLLSSLLLCAIIAPLGLLSLVPENAEAASRIIRLRGNVHVHGGVRFGGTSPVTASAPAEPEPPATEDMVAWYRGDSLQGSGTATAWNDKTANGRNATAFNGISIITDAIGTRSAARFVRGSGSTADYFHWDGDAALSQPFSAVAIIKPDAATGYGPALGASGLSFGNGRDGSNLEDSILYVSGFGQVTGTDIVDASWHTVEGVFNGSSSDIYVDGINVGTVGGTPGSSGLSYIAIGSADLESTGLGESYYSYDGDIAEIIIYDRELTSGERAELDTYVADYYGL